MTKQQRCKYKHCLDSQLKKISIRLLNLNINCRLNDVIEFLLLFFGVTVVELCRMSLGGGNAS